MTNEKEYTHRQMKHKIQNGGIYLYNFKDEVWQYLCRYMEVVEVRTDLISGNVDVLLEYLHDSERKEMTLSREVFIKNKILNELPLKGIDVTDKNVTSVIDYLLSREEVAPRVNVHEAVGWVDLGGKRVFLLQQAIGSDRESEYCGELGIMPKGTYELWKEIIGQEVIGNYPLELALILGLSAPLASLLSKLLGIDVLFYHIYGNSTTGKTTALIVATSPFGFPSKGSNGLIKTWLATDNALLGSLTGIHGLPMAIDEASVRVNSNYANMIYQIADGIEKGRMDKNGKTKPRGRWSGTFLSTAENSLLNNSNQNNGLRVRVQELGSLQWTNSAQNAEALKSGLAQNYGHAGLRFVEYLQELSDEVIIDYFKDCKEKVLQNIASHDSFTERIADKIAVVYMTAALASQALDLPLNVLEILQILLEAEASQFEDRDLGRKAYQFIKEEIMRNLNKFIYKDGLSCFNSSNGQYGEKELPIGEIIGRLDYVGKKMTEALILKKQLEKLLIDGGFTDINVILTEWRGKGIINCDPGKFTRKRTLHNKGDAPRVVVIKMDNPYESEERAKAKQKIAEARSEYKNGLLKRISQANND